MFFSFFFLLPYLDPFSLSRIFFLSLSLSLSLHFLQSPTPAPSLICPFGPPDCSGHGTPVPPCECSCDAGWLTATTQDLANFRYCGVAASSTPTPTPAPSPSELGVFFLN